MIKILKRILYIAGAVLSVAAIAGCNDFLAKPVSSEACLKAIKKFLGE